MFCLLLIITIGICVSAQDSDPWVSVLNTELIKARECLPHEYQALMNDWFVYLLDTQEYTLLYVKALDSIGHALIANKPFCRTLNAALHRTLGHLEYQLAQEQYRVPQGLGWEHTLEHMKKLRHTLLRQCDESLYKQSGSEIRQCMSQIRLVAMQKLALYHIGE